MAPLLCGRSCEGFETKIEDESGFSKSSDGREDAGAHKSTGRCVAQRVYASSGNVELEYCDVANRSARHSEDEWDARLLEYAWLWALEDRIRIGDVGCRGNRTARDAGDLGKRDRHEDTERWSRGRKTTTKSSFHRSYARRDRIFARLLALRSGADRRRSVFLRRRGMECAMAKCWVSLLLTATVARIRMRMMVPRLITIDNDDNDDDDDGEMKVNRRSKSVVTGNDESCPTKAESCEAERIHRLTKKHRQNTPNE